MTTLWVHTHLPRLRSGEVDCLSVKVPGRRIAYASWISLSDAEFRVSERGRLRCLREGVRNVHAWVVGTEIVRCSDYVSTSTYPLWRKAVYDPFKGPLFVDSVTLEPVRSAQLVILSGKNVHYVPVEV